MIALCLMAAFVTEFVSNSAAIALMFPVVYDAAMGIGCNPLPFAIALLLAVNAAFLTPISPPLNLLVYGPGGYRATDYLRIGLLVKLAYLIRLQKGLNIVVLDFTSATQPSCSEGRRREGPWR